MGWRSTPFYGGSAAQAESKGAGVRGSAPRGGENGEERGASGKVGNSSGGRHRPPAGGCGWRRCRVTGEGGGARATWARAVDKRDRATSVPGGQRLGAGGSETKQGSAVRGADRRARQHSAARFGFKPIQTESKIFQMVQTDLKFFKF
jgi:hypothetical protein